MNSERRIADFVSSAEYEQIPSSAIRVVKHILLAVLGAGLAGADEGGCPESRNYVAALGGRGEASVFFSGIKVPARNAAFANGVACRALDYCDAMAPGLHMGSSIVPVALAVAEKLKGCSGRDFLCALAIGAEIGARFNLSESEYSGFDPTGVAGVFAATAAACRMMRLPREKTLNAMALAFNRAGGSFQSNVDGSLAVRTIQGWVAETGIMCAELADLGITGPAHFIEGIYGYRKLFARGNDGYPEIERLGLEYYLERTVFKQFPSCGLTQGATQLALEAIEQHSIDADNVEHVVVRVPPYAHKLVGHPFAVGENPRVNAQFSIQFCVANAILNKSSRLSHFVPAHVTDGAIKAFTRRIEVHPDHEVDRRGHTAIDIDIALNSRDLLSLKLDHPSGFPQAPLSEAAHLRRFEDCMEYSPVLGAAARGKAVVEKIQGLETSADVRDIVALLSN